MLIITQDTSTASPIAQVETQFVPVEIMLAQMPLSPEDIMTTKTEQHLHDGHTGGGIGRTSIIAFPALDLYSRLIDDHDLKSQTQGQWEV